jgi:hypothetical protein
VLRGSAKSDDLGKYPNVRISVSDGKASASLPAFTITVAAPSASGSNRTPTMSGSPPNSVRAGQTYTFQPSASDPDGDRLRFSISSKPSWASFSTTTGRLWGAPRAGDVGSHEQIQISVSDGAQSETLPQFAVTVVPSRKANYGHYFATRYSDTPADAAMLCEQVGVHGIVWRRTWNEIEPTAGGYAAIATSSNPTCQVWLFVEFKSS